MAIYLVDSENVHAKWPDSLIHVKSGDEIVMLYSDMSGNLDFRSFDMFDGMDVNFKFLKCFRTGENSLDFQLVSELGYRIAHNPDQAYYIVSCDTGFDSVVQYWQSRGIKIQRIIPPLNSNSGDLVIRKNKFGEDKIIACRPVPCDVMNSDEMHRSHVLNLLCETDKACIDNIMKAFDSVKLLRKSRRSIEFRNKLTCEFGLSHGHALYNQIKGYTAPVLKALPEFREQFQEKSETQSLPAQAPNQLEGENSDGVLNAAMIKPVQESNKKLVSWAEFQVLLLKDAGLGGRCGQLKNMMPNKSKPMAEHILACAAWTVVHRDGHSAKEKADKAMSLIRFKYTTSMSEAQYSQIRTYLTNGFNKPKTWPSWLWNLEVMDLPAVFK